MRVKITDEQFSKLIANWGKGPAARQAIVHPRAEPGSDLAKARIAAHAALDLHWDPAYAVDDQTPMSRSEAYRKLALHMHIPSEDCHIGRFNENQCAQVVRICAKWSTE